MFFLLTFLSFGLILPNLMPSNSEPSEDPLDDDENAPPASGDDLDEMTDLGSLLFPNTTEAITPIAPTVPTENLVVDPVTESTEPCEKNTGTNGDDILTIDASSSYGETIYALDGDDYVYVGIGNELLEHASIDAGAGNDTIVNYDSIYVNIAAGDGNDIIQSNQSDSVQAGAGDDVVLVDFTSIYQDDAVATIDGGDGDDLLFSRSEISSEWEAAIQSQTGGQGADVFAHDLILYQEELSAGKHTEAPTHTTIEDFDPSQDIVELRIDNLSKTPNLTLETDLKPTGKENEYFLEVTLSDQEGTTSVSTGIYIVSQSSEPLTTDKISVTVNEYPFRNPSYTLGTAFLWANR